MGKRRRKRDRLYERKGRGWYADLRDFKAVGGGQEAMKPEGSRRATHDRDEASRILAARLEVLQAKMDGGGSAARVEFLFSDYVRTHLDKKRRAKRESTCVRDEQSLRIFAGFLAKRFGRDLSLSEINVDIIEEFDGLRMDQGMAIQTRLNDLHAISSLFKGAVARGDAEKNPARDMPEKPKPEKKEAEWLEPTEAAAILKAAGEADAKPGPRVVRFLRPLLATFLLSGGRTAEVFGLEVGDVDFDGSQVRFHSNRLRKLKTDTSTRRVPLWPQLEEILREYVEENDRTDGLLFPSANGGMLKDIRGSLNRVLKEAKMSKRITNHTFRHTYASQRIQTVEETRTPWGEKIWVPVSLLTVAEELGHRDVNMIAKVYGHLQKTPHRSLVVEYIESVVVDFPSSRVREA